MKKILLIFSFLCWAFTALLANNMNPFAYGLKSSYNASNKQLTVSFKVNAAAQSIQVIATSSQGTDYVLYTHSCPTAGPVEVTNQVINLSYIPSLPLNKGERFTWRVDVKGAAVETPQFVLNNLKLYCPTSIDIDNNPENANFGTVFCIEGRSNAMNNSNYTNYMSYVDGAGLYLINADGHARRMPRKDSVGWGLEGNTIRYGYNGGVKDLQTFGQQTFGSNKGTYGPYRIRLSDDGRIFVTSLTTNGKILWEVDNGRFSATNGTEWSTNTGWREVFTGVMASNKRNCQHTYCGIYGIYEGNAETGTFVAGPNLGFDVWGRGPNLKLVMLSGCKEAIVNKTSTHFYCREYNLGEAKTWNKAPNRAYFSGHVVNYDGAQVQYDRQGKVWLCQNSDTASLMKFNPDGTIAYRQDVPNQGGAMRFNEDFTKLAVATGTGKVSIYNVLKNGEIDWTAAHVVDMSAKIGSSIKDMVWDYANNLYIAADGDGGRCVAIYAMPHDGSVVSTPAASKYAIAMPPFEGITWWNLFQNGEDISDPEDLPYGNNKSDNERLWRLFQTEYLLYSYNHNYGIQRDGGYDEEKQQYKVHVYFYKEQNDNKNEPGTIYDKVLEPFIETPGTSINFNWLKKYIEDLAGKEIDNNDNSNGNYWGWFLQSFINRKDEFYYADLNKLGKNLNGTTQQHTCPDFSRYGHPDYWRPVWTESVCQLPRTLSGGVDLPNHAQWNRPTDLTHWGIAPKEYYDNTTKYEIHPYEWYQWLTPPAETETVKYIMAWREGKGPVNEKHGDIVHRITRDNMQLYVSYVRKHLDENDPAENKADPSDATNNDVIQLLNNENFKKTEHYDFAPVHRMAVTRRLQAGMFNTICLPFKTVYYDCLNLLLLDPSHPLWCNTEGEGATVMEFTGVTQEGDKSVLNFTRVYAMESGKPYILKLADGANDVTTDMPFGLVSCHPELYPVKAGGLIFNPTLNPTEVPKGSIILVADNRLALTTRDGKMAGMRGYFSIDPDADPQMAKDLVQKAAAGKVVLSVKQPVVTDILQPNAVLQSESYKIMQDGKIYILRGEEVYSITGHRVR